MQPSTVDSRLQDRLCCYPVATISGFSLSQIGDSENFFKNHPKTVDSRLQDKLCCDSYYNDRRQKIWNRIR